jgi:exopolyphosphatase / guanosine-5'-triphosphate,3'-diphosphate pyrophosphatase
LKTKKIAAIDIGSNAMRLLINNVIEINGTRLFKKMDIVRVPIRLGTESFKEKIILPETRARLIHAMHAYSHLMKAHEVSIYRGCATSAMREAVNGPEVIEQIKKETGINIEIISGKEEAQIIYSTHIEQLLNPEKYYLYVDVGGGSTEITFFANNQTVASRSFNIGTIRILNDMVNTAMWEEMKQWLKETIKDKPVELIGSGGNINKVFKISLREIGKPLSYDYIRKFYNTLKQYTYEERIIHMDLNPDRADVIIPALDIYTSIMRWTKAERIYVPKIGLSDGIIRQIVEENFH